MRRSLRSGVVLAAAAALSITGTAEPAAAEARRGLPSTYVVSTAPGAVPEGVHVTPDGTMYVSSYGDGSVRRGHVRDGVLHEFVPAGADGRTSALGVHADRRGRVFVVGGSGLHVYDRHARLVAARSAPGGPLGPSSLNDLVITRDAVYVTDWANPVVWRAPLRGSHVGELEPWLDVRSAFPAFPAQYWLLNGIVAAEDGRTLLVASNGTEAVWRVDVASRAVSRLDLGGVSFGPDGMVLDGRTLHAVINYGAADGVYVARLDSELRTGHVVHAVTDGPAAADTPTTLARHRCRLYVVNSQLDRAPGTPPYTVSAVADPACAR